MQHSHEQRHSSPYAGEQKRAIKALSEGEIDGYVNGRGMGLARAAELNGYPGPMHVLELADELKLTREQRAKTQALQGTMREAARIGKLIVSQERKLDALFAGGKATEAGVSALVREIGRLQAENRLVHLRAHVKMKQILSAAQVARYDQLRGYHRAG